MQITDVRIRKVEKEGKMKAVVSITIDDELSRCRAEKPATEISGISHIRSIPRQGIRFRD